MPGMDRAAVAVRIAVCVGTSPAERIPVESDVCIAGENIHYKTSCIVLEFRARKGARVLSRTNRGVHRVLPA